MPRVWDQDIVFTHPQTGRSVVLQDTEAAVVFLADDWVWGDGPELTAAAEACHRVMEEDEGHEAARQAVAGALEAIGIILR